MFPEDFIGSKEVLGNVVRYFASFGEAIRDFTVEEFCQEDERDAGKSYKINDFHKMADNQERELIPLKLESSGTLKMFALYPSLKDVLVDHGGTLFLDELMIGLIVSQIASLYTSARLSGLADEMSGFFYRLKKTEIEYLKNAGSDIKNLSGNQRMPDGLKTKPRDSQKTLPSTQKQIHHMIV